MELIWRSNGVWDSGLGPIRVQTELGIPALARSKFKWSSNRVQTGLKRSFGALWQAPTTNGVPMEKSNCRFSLNVVWEFEPWPNLSSNGVLSQR